VPGKAVKTIQERAGLQHELCTPLLGMVDQLGVSRAEAHRGVLQAARQALMARVQSLDAREHRVKLERLLNASFKYLGMYELREVPFAVMEKLENVPPVFLKQLTGDRQIFRDLPAKVQRQVWEFDKKLLQADALAPVGQFKYEVATIMRALAMDEFLPAVLAAAATKGAKDEPGSKSAPAPASRAAAGGRGGGGRAAQPRPSPVTGITRKILRKGSRVLQVLKGMVGTSQKIYNQIVELCITKYRDAEGLYVGFKELSYCTLRAQLLMALHDDNSAVATRDACHELAWTLDAGIMNGQLTDKHLQKLMKFFDDVSQAEQKRESIEERKRELARERKKKGNKRTISSMLDEEESAGDRTGGGGMVEPYRVLGEASIILRDPSAMHLLAAAVLQMVQEGALQGMLPRGCPHLTFVLSLMQLAVEGRSMLKSRVYKMPDAPGPVVHDVLPLLASYILLFETHGSPPAAEIVEGTEGDLPGGFGVDKAAVKAAMEVLARNEVARKLTQTFLLERLLRRDFLGATRCCRLLVEALSKSKGVVTEQFDFGGALAGRLAELVKARVVLPGCLLWKYAVDKVLVRLVDSHPQVHEEVLRLLLTAGPLLSSADLGQYLESTLENSKRSRRRVSKKAGGAAGMFVDPLADFPMTVVGSDLGSDIGSDGWPGIMGLKLKSSDGVRSVYAQFAKGRLTQECAPALYAYLAEGEQPPPAAPPAAPAADEVQGDEVDASQQPKQEQEQQQQEQEQGQQEYQGHEAEHGDGAEGHTMEEEML